MASPDAGRAFEVREIEKRITDLWRASREGEALVRACTLNLVVPCGDAGAASQAVALVSEHHPCRAIVVACGSTTGAATLQAWVSAHCHRGLGGRTTCSEQVTIEAGEEALMLVPDTVLQLLCEDLPVLTWWRRETLAHDPLLAALARLSDRVVVDTTALADPVGALRALASFASDPSAKCIEDLAWTRLEPFRGVVASLFDAPSMRPLLDGIQSIEIAAGGPSPGGGLTGAGAYLAGWLVARLGFAIDGRRVLRADGNVVAVRFEHDPVLGRGEIGSIRLDCRAGALEARMNAARIEASGDLVRVFIETERSCPLPRVLKLSKRDDVGLVSREIEREAIDPIFRSVLPHAAKLLGTIA